jgi:F-type H+-transporting ATPase subunit b
VKYISLLIIIILPQILLAAGGGGFDEYTKKKVIYQAINVTILFAAGIYFLKNHVIVFFKERKEVFVMAATKAEKIQKAAEEDQMALEVKLQKLESTSEESLLRARAEAAEMKKALINEAQETTRRIKEEASLAAQLEVEKAKNKIRSEMISASLKAATVDLNTSVSEEQHKGLQKEFISGLGGN